MTEIEFRPNNRDKLINTLADLDKTLTELNIAGLDLAHQAAMRFMRANEREVGNEQSMGWLDLATASGSGIATTLGAWRGEDPNGKVLTALGGLVQGLGTTSKILGGSTSTKLRAVQSKEREVNLTLGREISAASQKATETARQRLLELLRSMYK